MPGAGKQKHVGLQKDPETQEKLLEQERKKAEELQGILNQIEAILKLYGSIKIFALNRNKGIRFTVRNVLKQETFTSIDQIPIKKLVRLLKKREELYFQPTQEETIKAVFLMTCHQQRKTFCHYLKTALWCRQVLQRYRFIYLYPNHCQ